MIIYIIQNLPEYLKDSFYKKNDLKIIFENGIKLLFEDRNLPIAVELLKGLPEVIFEEYTKEIKDTDFFKELKNNISF